MDSTLGLPNPNLTLLYYSGFSFPSFSVPGNLSLGKVWPSCKSCEWASCSGELCGGSKWAYPNCTSRVVSATMPKRVILHQIIQYSTVDLGKSCANCTVASHWSKLYDACCWVVAYLLMVTQAWESHTGYIVASHSVAAVSPGPSQSFLPGRSRGRMRGQSSPGKGSSPSPCIFWYKLMWLPNNPWNGHRDLRGHLFVKPKDTASIIWGRGIYLF